MIPPIDRCEPSPETDGVVLRDKITVTLDIEAMKKA
jgi:hypothetical protein